MSEKKLKTSTKIKDLLRVSVLTTFWVSVLLFAGSVVFATNHYHYLQKTLPEPTKRSLHSQAQTSRIYDRHGELLFELYGDTRRREVKLEKIPKVLQEATIAIEDKDFYQHRGFDLSAIGRAFYKNLESGEIKQGASTLTQQLARAIYLSREKSYTRKIKELVLALEIEKRYSKNEILEMYLNNAPYGSNTLGVAAASSLYFDKEVSDLSPIEAIYLAALPKAPGDLSPYGPNVDDLRNRAELVMSAMQKNGYLNEQDVVKYKEMGMPNFKDESIVIKAPHFVFYVIDELKKKYSERMLQEGGFDIYTSLDLELQNKATEIVQKWAKINEEEHNANNAALVAMDPQNGEVLAMVGSRDYFGSKDGNFNVALSPRQPGSSFKPYVYAAAIKKQMHPNTVLIDQRTNFAKYNNGIEYYPRNYNGRYYGAVTIRKALAGSLNIPAVKALVETGIEDVVRFTSELGIESVSKREGLGPSLALGGADISLLEHVGAMSVFANGGIKQEISPVLRISDQEGRLVFKKEQTKGKEVLDPGVAYWINDMLSDTKSRAYIFGGDKTLEIPDRQVAAKTGTTQDYRDAWTIGYTPNLAVGVWAGNNDFSPMAEGSYGLKVAGPIWNEFTAAALEKMPKVAFTRPADLEDPPLPVFPEIASSTEDATSTKATRIAKADDVDPDEFALERSKKIDWEKSESVQDKKSETGSSAKQSPSQKEEELVIIKTVQENIPKKSGSTGKKLIERGERVDRDR